MTAVAAANNARDSGATTATGGSPMTERWLPVVGWEGLYEVSDQGHVRSVERTIYLVDGRVRTFPSKILIPGRRDSGHLQVALWRDNKGKTRKIHQLVLEAFVGPCPEGMECRHDNDIPDDNRRSNLRWGTRSENHRDRVRNGIHHQAIKTHCPRHHEYTPENTIIEHNRRHCRTCDIERKRRGRQRV